MFLISLITNIKIDLSDLDMIGLTGYSFHALCILLQAVWAS